MLLSVLLRSIQTDDVKHAGRYRGDRLAVDARGSQQVSLGDVTVGYTLGLDDRRVGKIPSAASVTGAAKVD